MQYRGLLNLGNTCYMNSFMQALFLCSNFRQLLLDLEINRIMLQIKDCIAKKSNSKPNISLLMQVQKLFALMAFSKRRCINPALFRQTLPLQFKGNYQQQDASEFGKILLDELDTTFKKLEIYQNLIKDTFIGEQEWSIECMECNTIFKRKEEFLDLNLSFHSDQPLSLQQMIEQNHVVEILEGENKFECDQCKKKTVGKRSSAIVSLSTNLIITLNRFHFHSSSKNKILTPVEVPNMVQINGQTFYLSSIVVHQGSKMDFGHYFTLSRYTIFNDEQVFQYKDIQQTLRSLSPQQTPYILFYKGEYQYTAPEIKTSFIKNIVEQDNESWRNQQQQQQQQQQQYQQQFQQDGDDQDDDNNGPAGPPSNQMIF